MSSFSSEKEFQKSIENVMKKRHYENFNEWVKNFTLNLPNIINEKSAKELNQKFNNNRKNDSAIVIGRGPSINKHEHLKLLANSNYNGTIVCCDGKLGDALKAGVTPDKFPNFYVVTMDPYPSIKSHFEHEIIKSYSSKIKGMFTVITNPEVVNKAREIGIQIHWFHSLFDYNDGEKSFNNLSALMIRAKNESHKLPAVQTGGNVGTTAWFVAWKILNCSTVALIGINHGWNGDDPLELILSHGHEFPVPKIDKSSPTFQKLFKEIHNPDFDCDCILDPLYQFYREAFKEFIVRSPDWLTTINATEGGSIFGERIKSLKFSEFLENYS